MEFNDTVFRTVMIRIPSSLPERETWKNNKKEERKKNDFLKQEPLLSGNSSRNYLN